MTRVFCISNKSFAVVSRGKDNKNKYEQSLVVDCFMFYHVVQPTTELIFARLQTSVCYSRLAKQNLVYIAISAGVTEFLPQTFTQSTQLTLYVTLKDLFIN